MDLGAFIAQYGYIGIALGCMLEGETVAVLGGIAANTYLSLPMVYLMAFLGTWLWDSMLFLIGYRYGPQITNRFSKYQSKINKVESMIKKYDLLAIIGLRFLYGLRTVGPLAVGISKVNIFRFIVCNAVGSALWSSIFITLGYTAGKVFQEQLNKLGHQIVPILIIAVIIFAIFLIIRVLISRYTHKSND